MKPLCFLLLLILVSGCASPRGPVFQASPTPTDKATVYVYRTNQRMGWGGLIPTSSPHTIWLNGTQPMSLRPADYCVYHVTPGSNSFSSKLRSANAPLDAAFQDPNLFNTNFLAATTYYLKFEVGAVSPKMKQMNNEVGEKEIQRCTLAKPGK
jgi:hypothetical protein